MTDLDPIAAKYSDELDRVYPPMTWVAQWIRPETVPFSPSVPKAIRDYFGAPDFYDAGLWIFSEEGHHHRIVGGEPEWHGRTVIAWNRREAEARMRGEEPTPATASPARPASPP